LRTFATLSPIPGFRKWLTAKGESDESVRAILGRITASSISEDRGELKRRLLALCASYLFNEKRGKEPLDSVARFHLKNGARLDRINWLADMSASGIRQSAGIMANYVYELKDLERNHEMYARSGQIACSRRIQALAAHKAASIHRD
jgi:malonyl-CoA decarboxylase